MTHLSDETLLDLVEAGQAHPHLSDCERCRRAADEARAALTLARAEPVPEPSPLFWDRLSARVGEAVENAPCTGHRPARSWFRIPAWQPVGVLALIALVVVVTWHLRDAGSRAPRVASMAAPASSPAPPGGTPVGDMQPAADLLLPPADASWFVIEQVAANVHVASAADAGLVLQPDASERAIAQLSPAEQQELVRLLQADPDGPSQ